MNNVIAEIKKVESSRERIANYIRQRISSKEFRPGDQLPTTQELALAARVSGHTVRSAMASLESEGLIYSSRGRGTFVCEQSTLEVDGESSLGVTAVAIMGLVADDSLFPDKYRTDTAAGFIIECEKRSVVAQIYSNKYRKLSPEKLVKILRAMGCKSIIWTSPTDDERETILNVIELGMPVVVTYRADVTDWLPMVAADFVYGGYRAGSYLRSKGCTKAMVIGYNVNSESKPLTMAGGLPNGLLTGLSEGLGVDILEGESIKRDVITGYDEKTSLDLIGILKQANEAEGFIIANPYNFRNLIRDFPEQALPILKQKPFVIIANNVIIRKIAHFAHDINFPVIVDPFEDIAKIAVDKILSTTDGKISNTKTLVKPYFEMFWDISAAKGNDN